MTKPKELIIEQGPIRPPSEAASLLLRFTRNCPWNNCTFCPVYKGRKFSRRTLKEIRHDIDIISNIIEDLHRLSESVGDGGQLTRRVINTVLTSSAYNNFYRQVAVWARSGTGTVFIQDANSLLLPTDALVKALRYLKSKVPGIERITSYARSNTLSRKSLQELCEIYDAGLNRIHIGLESGSDRVLKFVHKGVTAAQHIDAGRKVVEAGISLSEYVMPGLGGTDLSKVHAVETARVLNEIDPHFIRLRSLRVPRSAPLYDEMLNGRFVPLSDDDTVLEIRLFIESLEGIRSVLASDHIMNLLEEVEGTFPDGKEKMLGVIDRYLALSPTEKLIYRLGRRGGAIRSLDDLTDPQMRQRLEFAMRDLASQTGGNLEKLITELGNQYI